MIKDGISIKLDKNESVERIVRRITKDMQHSIQMNYSDDGCYRFLYSLGMENEEKLREVETKLNESIKNAPYLKVIEIRDGKYIDNVRFGGKVLQTYIEVKKI